MFLFTNFVLNEHPLAYCQLEQSKLFLPYQQHTALVIHSLKFFVMKKCVPNVDKLKLYLLRAIDPVSLSLAQVFALQPILIFAALV